MHASFIHARHLTASDHQPPRLFLLFLGLILGALGWLSIDLVDAHDPLYPFTPGKTALLLIGWTMTAALPLSMMLMVTRPSQPGFWLQSLMLGALVSGLSLWAAWGVEHAPYINPWQVLVPFGLSVVALMLLLLPFFQMFLRHRALRGSYADLFEFAWQNALCLLLTAAFVLICWALLALWAWLFNMIGVSFFWEVFTHRTFVPIASGLIVASGVLISRSLSGPMRALRQVIFSVFDGLLPTLSLVSLTFAGTLAYIAATQGMNALWETGISGYALLALVGLMTLMINAVYQDASAAPDYRPVSRWVIHAGILTLPALAALALHALQLRLAQHGFSQLRLAGLLISALLTLHAIGYALAVLLPGRERLAAMKPFNVIAAWIAIILLLLVNSPVLDLHRMSVDQQVERLLKGEISPEDFDIKHLRYDSGRYGLTALTALDQRLRELPAAARTQPEEASSLSASKVSGPSNTAAAPASAETVPESSRAMAPEASNGATPEAAAKAEAAGRPAPADSARTGRGIRHKLPQLMAAGADRLPPALTDPANAPTLAALAQNEHFITRLKQILDTSSRHEADMNEQALSWLDDPKALAAHIKQAPGVGTIENTWWEALANEDFGPKECRSTEHDCVLIERDLDSDGLDERMLCILTPSYWGVECQLYSREQTAAVVTSPLKGAPASRKPTDTATQAGERHWQQVGRFYFHGTHPDIAEIRRSLATGEFKLTKPRWPVIESHGAQAVFQRP
ncbi:MAG: DUF4153 domain-containing protein [Lautropia sp.]|nr:DUF4153 domain-containing protein [Lautropia sp.]